MPLPSSSPGADLFYYPSSDSAPRALLHCFRPEFCPLRYLLLLYLCPNSAPCDPLYYFRTGPASCSIFYYPCTGSTPCAPLYLRPGSFP